MSVNLRTDDNGEVSAHFVSPSSQLLWSRFFVCFCYALFRSNAWCFIFWYHLFENLCFLGCNRHGNESVGPFRRTGRQRTIIFKNKSRTKINLFFLLFLFVFSFVIYYIKYCRLLSFFLLLPIHFMYFMSKFAISKEEKYLWLNNCVRFISFYFYLLKYLNC